MLSFIFKIVARTNNALACRNDFIFEKFYSNPATKLAVLGQQPWTFIYLMPRVSDRDDTL